MTPARHRDLAWTDRARLAELAAGDLPWRYYRTTTVTIAPPGRPAVTVVPADLAEAEPDRHETGEQTPGLAPLHVITAVQPGADPDGADSAARLQILRSELAAAGHDPIPATGSAIDGSHAEPGFAVTGWTDGQAREWGVRFGQVAVFGLRGPTLALIACAAARRDDLRWCRRST